VTKFKISDLNYLGKLSMSVFRVLHMVRWEEKKYSTNDNETYVECNNLTLINFVLIWNGPTHEETLTIILLTIQVCTCIAPFYPLNVICSISLFVNFSCIREDCLF
jgi:UDP-N-acetylglucosamine--dolichyl-phosphate N-acetylglucosaminephosphotransferase